MFTLCSALKLYSPIRCTSRNHRRRRVYGISYTERSSGLAHYLVRSSFGTSLGSLLILNIIAIYRQMTHDENVYSDPFTFNPERFLEENGHTSEPDPRGTAFGFGRRSVLIPVLFLNQVFTQMLGYVREKKLRKARCSSLQR